MKNFRKVLAIVLCLTMSFPSQLVYAAEVESEDKTIDIIADEDLMDDQMFELKQATEPELVYKDNEEVNGATSLILEDDLAEINQASGDFGGIHYEIDANGAMTLSGTWNGSVSAWNAGSKTATTPWQGSAVKSINCGSLAVAADANCDGLFANMTGLTTFVEKNWAFKNAGSANYMFYGDTALVNMEYEFICGATTATHMFDGCTSLVSIDPRMGRATDISYMFYNCTGLKYVYGFFGGGGITTFIQTSDRSTVTTANYFLYGCSSLCEANISSLLGAKLTSATNMFPDSGLYMIKSPLYLTVDIALPTFCTWKDINEKTYTTLIKSNYSSAPLSNGYYCKSGYTGSIAWNIADDGTLTFTGTTGGKAPANGHKDELYYNPFSRAKVKKAVFDFECGTNSLSLLCAEMDNLESVSFTSRFLATTDKLTSISNMFSGDRKLKSVDFSGFKFAATGVDLGYLFVNCSSLESVKWPTTTFKVTDLSGTFWAGSKLTSLDMSSMDLSSYKELTYKTTSTSSSGSTQINRDWMDSDIFYSYIKTFKSPKNLPSGMKIQLTENSTSVYKYYWENSSGIKATQINGTASETYKRRYVFVAPALDTESGELSKVMNVIKRKPYINTGDRETTTYQMKFYYTLDGTTPTKNSTELTADGISLRLDNANAKKTVKVIGYSEAYGEYSEVATYQYTGPSNPAPGEVIPAKEGDYKGLHYVLSESKQLILTGKYEGGSFGTTKTSAPWADWDVVEIDATKASLKNAGDSVQGIFAGMKKLKSIQYTYLVSGSYDASYAFYGCESLTDVGISYTNTSDASYMFYGCKSLSMSYIEAESATKLDYMYANCSSITYIGGRYGKEYKSIYVNSLNGFALGCDKLEKLFLGQMQLTHKEEFEAKDMLPKNATFMIYCPYYLDQSIELPTNKKWYDAAGKEFTIMPKRSESYTSAGCSYAQISNGYCPKSGSADYKWQLSDDGVLTITDNPDRDGKTWVFGYEEICNDNHFAAKNVKKVIVDCDAKYVTSCFFAGYINCEEYEFSDKFKNSFDKVTNLFSFFEQNKKLKEIDLSDFNFNTESKLTLKYMFESCTNLETVKWPDKTIKVSSCYWIFKDAKISLVDFSHMDFSAYSSSDFTFSKCKLSHFSTNCTEFRAPLNAPEEMKMNFDSYEEGGPVSYWWIDENKNKVTVVDLQSTTSKTYKMNMALSAPKIISSDDTGVFTTHEDNTVKISDYFAKNTGLKGTWYYTLDGTTPTKGSSKFPDSGIELSAVNFDDTFTLKVRGYSEAYGTYTETATKTYKFKSSLVTFDSMGGSAVASVRVFADSKVSIPATPIREDYKFLGWYTSSDYNKAYDFDKAVSKDITLYAKWMEIEDLTKSYALVAGSQEGYWIGQSKEADIPANREWTYTGYEIQPDWKVINGKYTMLTKGEDYVASYKNNINASTDSEMASFVVTFKDKSIDKLEVGFLIKPFDIATDNSESVKVEFSQLAAMKATGKQLTPAKPKASFVSTENRMSENVSASFVIESYGENVLAGPKAGSMVIAGKGNFTGKRTLYFDIAAYSMSEAKISTAKGDPKWVSSFEYDGKAKTQEVVLRLKNARSGEILAKDKDYRVSYSPNVEAGKVTVTFEGISEKLGGTMTKTFTIKGEKISKAVLRDSKNNLIKSIPAETYNGSAHDVWKNNKYKLSLYDAKTKTYTDISTNDYQISYTVKDKESNVNAGTATLIISGNNQYAGSTKTIKFKINPYDLTNETGIDKYFKNQTVVYTKGDKHCPNIESIVVKNMTILRDTDYKLVASNNTKATDSSKPAVVKLIGKGNFKGARAYTFDITKKNIGTLSDVSTSPVKVNTSKRKAGDFKPAKLIIKDTNGKSLTGADYETKSIKYLDTKTGKEIDPKAKDVPVGTEVKIVIMAKGNYTGSLTITYLVESK